MVVLCNWVVFTSVFSSSLRVERVAVNHKVIGSSPI
jgi:hypothetical protein